MNIPIVIYILGRVMLVEGVFMAAPAVVGLCYQQFDAAIAFWAIGFIEALLGFVVSFKKPTNTSFYAKEGFVITSLSWVVLGVIGAIPFVISGDIPNYLDALFETVSGFTTTGASILSDVERLSKPAIFWRSFSHWLGGMGVLVFVLIVLPLSSAQNIYLMRAESPGPSVGKLVPKVKSTAGNLYKIYCTMTVTEMIVLLIGGMDVFSAMTMSFGTAGTGGFGILNSSCGEYSSFVQITITVFMLLFAINFSVYYLLITKKFRQALACEELRWFLGIVFVSIALIAFNSREYFTSIGSNLKHVSFTVASIISSTGFSTVDFNQWPEFSKSIILALMFCGACAGSTGGGMKVSRMVIYLKSLKKIIGQYLHPRSVKIIKFEGKQIEHDVVRGVNTFLIAFAFIFAASTLLISLDNFSFETNFSAVAATMNNIGPGFDAVGPTSNFSNFSWHSKIVLIFDMLLGRLEIFPILLLFAPSTYKKL